jgi:hypothetical protein
MCCREENPGAIKCAAMVGVDNARCAAAAHTNFKCKTCRICLLQHIGDLSILPDPLLVEHQARLGLQLISEAAWAVLLGLEQHQLLASACMAIPKSCVIVISQACL